jgi:hypothetical protein
MPKRIVLSLLTVILMSLAVEPVKVAAQTTDDPILYACYIPMVGVVYRVKAPGLPTGCLSRNHVEFHWNAQGIKGDRGDSGPAGNLALAGQSCPVGSFVTGFNSQGGLVCNNSGGGGDVPPPPTSSAIDGVWSFSPAVSMVCTDAILNGGFTISSMRVTASSGRFLAEIFGVASFNGFSDQRTFATVDLGAVPSTLTFPFDVSGSRSQSLPSPFTGTINFAFNGAFTSSTSANGTLDMSVTGKITLSIGGVPISADLNCAPVSATIAAGR